MQEFRGNGIVSAIGVCNFRERHWEALSRTWEFTPEIVQTEIHPLRTADSLMRFYRERNLAIQAYSPLALMNPKLARATAILKLAEKYEKTPAQIILRWHIEKGFFPLPKASSIGRLKENFSVFDFRLEAEETEEISALNCGWKCCLESTLCVGY